MAGLGSVTERIFVYLTIAGGYIWNKKAPSTDKDYGEQSYRKTEDKEGEPDSGLRQGARYEKIDGTVKNVEFKEHPKYGQSISVKMDIGLDKDYILSVSTNNRYSQDLMKALLKGDLDKEYSIRPYDFIGSDKRRASGIVFHQNGAKMDLKMDEAPSKPGDWFKEATKKAKKRFFEDLNDWYVAQVEEFVIPELDRKANDTKPTQKADEAVKETVVEEVVEEVVQETVNETQEDTVENSPQVVEGDASEKISPIKMKRAIKAYMAENYEGVAMPKLSGDKLVNWYNLVLEEEELPIEEDTIQEKVEATEKVEEIQDAEMDNDDLDSEIDDLMNG